MNVKKLREKLNFTQTRLAAKIGTTQAVISNWENKHSAPNTKFTAKLRKLSEKTTTKST